MQPAVLNGTPIWRNPEAWSPSSEHRKATFIPAVEDVHQRLARVKKSRIKTAPKV
jgi:hypothetical protein